jgi:hypothetical protein
MSLKKRHASFIILVNGIQMIRVIFPPWLYLLLKTFPSPLPWRHILINRLGNIFVKWPPPDRCQPKGHLCYHWVICPHLTFTTMITFTRIGYLLHHKNPGSNFYITTALIIGTQSAMMNSDNGLHLTNPQPKLMAIIILVHSLHNWLILTLGFFHPTRTSPYLCYHCTFGIVYFFIVFIILLFLQLPWCWSVKIKTGYLDYWNYKMK